MKRRTTERGIQAIFRYWLLALALLGTLTLSLYSRREALATDSPVPLVGPLRYYLALGDSLAFGYQPNLETARGYSEDFYQNLLRHKGQSEVNLSCIGEKSATMIEGGCPFAAVRKYPYHGPQLREALSLLRELRGQVSPVSIDIGANDILPDLDLASCTEYQESFATHLLTLERNLHVIVGALHGALTRSDGGPLGDLIVANYYNPAQNACPLTKHDVQLMNLALNRAVGSYGRVADVFTAFGGNGPTPNPRLCSYTWMCSRNPLINPMVLLGQGAPITPLKEVAAQFEKIQAIHATSEGYAVIAQTVESTVGY